MHFKPILNTRVYWNNTELDDSALMLLNFIRQWLFRFSVRAANILLLRFLGFPRKFRDIAKLNITDTFFHTLFISL